ncbi:serine hydrolase domain-containing protein [Acidobacteriota bacterium]
MKDRINGFHILLFITIAIFLLYPEMAPALLKAGENVPQLENPPVVPKAFKDVHSFILNLMEKKKVPSITIAVAKDGKTLWEHGYGWADREKMIKATPDTVYHLASISKTMTATGLMVLEERGMVDLENPANDYLGDAKLVAHLGKVNDATVRRILFHTAGLPMYWNFFDMDGPNRRPAMDDAIRRYGILVTAPGETYTYSNFGYGIIDHIISRVSGKDYSEFMAEEVFIPLGMVHSSVQTDSNLMDNVAQMYAAGKKPIPPYDFDHRGASAVLSSVRDLIRFGLFHLKKPLPDQKRILKDETIERMHNETYAEIPGLKEQVGFDYLLGSFGGVDYEGYHIEATTGSMPGALSRLALVPAENIVTAVLANSDNIDLWEIEKAVFEALLPGLKEKVDSQSEKTLETAAYDPNPPQSFLGAWSGSMKTQSKTLPIKLTIVQNAKIRLEINGRSATQLKIVTPLGEMGFQGCSFRALFMLHLTTPDAIRSPHILLLECRQRRDRLTGYAAAIAMNQTFCLPYWIELARVNDED